MLLNASSTNTVMLKAAMEAQDDKAADASKSELSALVLFKSDMGAFLRLYTFLSQVFDYGNTAIEKRAIFYKRLDKPDAPIVELLKDFDSRYSFLDNEGNTFWVRTELDAPRGRKRGSWRGRLRGALRRGSFHQSERGEYHNGETLTHSYSPQKHSA